MSEIYKTDFNGKDNFQFSDFTREQAQVRDGLCFERANHV